MNSRNFFVGLALAGSALACCANDIVLAQIADFSGRGKGMSIPTSEGAAACIAAHNAGLRAPQRPVRLVLLDDQFDPARSGPLAEQAASEGAVAIINTVGAATTQAVAEVTNRRGVPVIGAITGATSVRARQHPSLFFIRASIAHEARHAAQHLATLGLRRIGVFHTRDAYGTDGVEAMQSAMRELGLPPPVTASYSVSAQDAGEAVAALAGVQAVVMFGSGPVLSDFVRRTRSTHRTQVLIAASAANMAALVQAVGVEAARGVGYLRSFPAPSGKSALGREFAAIWRQHGRDVPAQPFHLEGCLAAQLALRALGSGQAPAARPRLLEQMHALPAQRFGDLRIEFRKPTNEGSSWVGIAVVDELGQLRD